jgi:Flp pilus assembly protein TadG
MTASASRDRRGERASAALELALVLPLVLTMTLAVVPVGLLVKDQLVVADAARAGARQASVSTDDSSIRQAVVQAATSLSSDRLTVAVSRSGSVGSPVTVQVTYRAPIAVPVVTWLFPPDVRLSTSATMRQESG